MSRAARRSLRELATMGRCGTCRHWQDWASMTADGKAACVRVDDERPEDADRAWAIHATTDDVEGLDAWLMTGPAFGCVHHEERKAP